MKTKMFLSFIFGAILLVFFTQFNFYSKTYLSITTDHFVSEYKLVLNDTQTFSQKPPADYPFFYIFTDHYNNRYEPIIGNFTAYFLLPLDKTISNTMIYLQSSLNTIKVRNVCIHNVFKEHCWSGQELAVLFENNFLPSIENNTLLLPNNSILKYKDDFNLIYQDFLLFNDAKKSVVLTLLLSIIFLLIIRWRSLKKITFFSILKKCSSPQSIFLILGSIFAIMTIIINPIFQIPDELYHLSQAFYLTIKKDHLNETHIQLPMLAITTAAEIHLHYRQTNKLPEEKFDYFSKLPLHLQENAQQINNSTSLHVNLISPYWLPTIGLKLGVIFELSWLHTFYLIRLLHAFAWLLCGYLAIRAIPFSKWLLCLIALSPMSIFQASGISLDSLANGLSFLLIALVFGLVANKEKQWVFFLGILITSLLLGLSKIPYLFLLSLLLLISTQRSKQISVPTYTILSAIVLSLIMLSGLLFVVKNSTVFFNVATDLILSILQRPVDYFNIIIETVRMYGVSLIKEWVGRFGWLEIGLPNWFIILHIIVLIFYATTEMSTFILNLFSKLLILLIFFLGALIVFTTLYIIETPLIVLPYIDGLQGRYFIPFGILPFLLLQNRLFQLPNNVHIICSVIYIPFSLIFMLFTIWQYYAH